MRSFRGSYANRGNGTELSSSDVAGLESPSGTRRQAAPAAVAGIRLRRTGSRMGRRHQKGTPFRGRLSGAGGRTRTGTGLLPGDFKSPVSTVPPHRRALIIYHGSQDSSSRTRWTDCTRRAYTTPVCAPVRNDEAFFLGYVISSGVEKSKRRLLYRLHRLRSFDSLALAQDDTRNLPT